MAVIIRDRYCFINVSCVTVFSLFCSKLLLLAELVAEVLLSVVDDASWGLSNGDKPPSLSISSSSSIRRMHKVDVHCSYRS